MGRWVGSVRLGGKLRVDLLLIPSVVSKLFGFEVFDVLVVHLYPDFFLRQIGYLAFFSFFSFLFLLVGLALYGDRFS